MNDLFKLQQDYYLYMLNRNIFAYNARQRDYFKIIYSFADDQYVVDNKFYYDRPLKRVRENSEQ